MLLSDIPELRNYPHVFTFVRDHLSMQFGDVRAMLRLPLRKSGIEYGCNFAVTATLCNLVSGISVTMFKPSKFTRVDKGKKKWIYSGTAFKQLLKNHYPWEPGEKLCPSCQLKRSRFWKRVVEVGTTVVVVIIGALTRGGRGKGI